MVGFFRRRALNNDHLFVEFGIVPGSNTILAYSGVLGQLENMNKTNCDRFLWFLRSRQYVIVNQQEGFLAVYSEG